MNKNESNDIPPRYAFIAMSFDLRLQHIYDRVVRPVLEDFEFRCQRGDEISVSGVILEQIINSIENANVVICDLTFNNPNVFFELGIAYMLKKPTILIAQNAANIPFDVRHWRIIPYEDNKLGLLDLKEKLEIVLLD